MPGEDNPMERSGEELWDHAWVEKQRALKSRERIFQSPQIGLRV